VAVGQSVTKPIAPGNYYTTAVGSDTTYGLGFKALGAGEVVVAASGPAGVIATSQASRTIVINP
jgi:hypothetical protein